MHDGRGVGEVEVVREEVERPAVAGELKRAVFVVQVVHDADEYDAARVGTKIDAARAQVGRDGRTEAARTKDARVEDADPYARHAEACIVHNGGRERVRVAHRETSGVAELITGRWAGGQVVTVGRSAERKEVIAAARRVRFAVAREESVVL